MKGEVWGLAVREYYYLLVDWQVFMTPITCSGERACMFVHACRVSSSKSSPHPSLQGEKLLDRALTHGIPPPPRPTYVSYCTLLTFLALTFHLLPCYWLLFLPAVKQLMFGRCPCLRGQSTIEQVQCISFICSRSQESNLRIFRLLVAMLA